MESMEWSRVRLRGRCCRCARPRHAGLEGHRADLRRGSDAGPETRRVPPASWHRRAPRAQRAPAVGVWPCDRCPAPLQLPRIHRIDVGLLPRPGRALPRQPALPARGGRRPARHGGRRGRRVPPRARSARRQAARSRRPLLVDVDDGSEISRSRRQYELEDAASKCSPPRSLQTRLPTISTSCGREAPRVHRRGALATGRHLRLGDGRHRGASRESPRRSRRRVQARGSQRTPFDARGRAMDGVRGDHSGATIVSARTIRSHSTPAPSSRRLHESVSLHVHRRGRLCAQLDRELREKTYDLALLHTIATGGAPTSEPAKEALLELLPDVTIVDGLCASETGGWPTERRGARSSHGGFAPAAGCGPLRRQASIPRAGRRRSRLDGAAGARPLAPSVIRREPGNLPDRRRSARRGARRFVRGSRRTASSSARGDSLVVNSGGEKIFVEEVEEVIRGHSDVVDALVVGRPSDRFGEEVVGIVQLRPEVSLDPYELREFIARSIARFKAPRAIAFCDRIRRHPSGKGDYQWARCVAEQAVVATTRPVS